MMLSAEEIERYHERGYIVPKFRLSQSWLDRLRTAQDTLKAEHPHVGLDFVPSPHIPHYVPGVVEYEEWLAFAKIPEVVDAVCQLIGPDILMWGSALFGKPAFEGKETPMHQDGEYWPIKPLASVTVWIALDDSTPENGCLRVLPSSHKAKTLFTHARNDRPDWTLNQTLNDSRLDLDTIENVTLEAGQISIHDVYLVHGSSANNSPNARSGMTYRYMPMTSFFDHDWAGEMTRAMGTTDMSQRPLIHIRGEDKCGLNDFRRGHEVFPVKAE